MKKHPAGVVATVAVLLSLSFLSFTPRSYSQAGRTFTVLIRLAPPPEDPNGWTIVVPSDSNLQALYAAGFHPSGLGSFSTYQQAAVAADGLVMGRFPTECNKDSSIFWNPTTGDKVVVADLAQPKPFGYHLEQGGLCKANALALLGQPIGYRLLAKPGQVALLTKGGWAAGQAANPPPAKPPTTVTPTRPPTARVEPVVEEIPESSPPNNSGGGGTTPAVEEIPETRVTGGGSKSGATPSVEEIPETPVKVEPPRASTPPQQQPQPQQRSSNPQQQKKSGVDWGRVGTALGGAVRQSMGGQPGQGQVQGQNQGQQVGDEIRYGPFSATSRGWQSTGIQLQKGQSFKVEASGKITGKEGETLGPYQGTASWRWRVLCGKLGDKGVEFGGDGWNTAWQDGVLLLGVPRAYDFDGSPDSATDYWSGAFTVYIYLKRQ